MAKMRASNINGDLTFKADLVYATLLVAKYSQSLAYDATTGWNKIGALSVASDQSFQVGVETEEVLTGVPITAKDDLITRLNGEASFVITDINPLAGKWSMGTTADIVWDTSGTTWSGEIFGTTSTTSVLQLSTGDGTGLAVGDVLRVELSSGNNVYYYPALVDLVNGDAVTLQYPLPEIPAASSTVTRVRGYDLYHGGNALQNMAVLVQLDFPKGDQHILEIYKASATGGFTRQLSGAVKTPLQLKMYGTLKTIGSLADQVALAVTHVGFTNR